MAFGLTRKFVMDFNPGDITTEEFLKIAVATTEKLDWNISQLTDNGFVANTKLSFNSFGEEFRITIQDGKAELKSECIGSQLVDWGKNKANTLLFIQCFGELQEILTEEELAKPYDALKAYIALNEDNPLIKTPGTAIDKIKEFLFLFKPGAGYYVTPILIDLNILVFLLMIISGVNVFMPDADSLILWGANIRPFTTGGEWWRLLTNCFLHIGIVHLLMNMYALVYIGVLLEPHLGKARFATAYFLTGIAASICSLWWHELTISAGASGAIFGMYGVFLAMLTTNLIDKASRKPLLLSIGIFVFYNLAYGMKGGIDNAAHIGGLVSGLIIGYGYYPGLKVKPDAFQEYDIKKTSIGILSFVILFSCYLVYLQVPKDVEKRFLTRQDLEKYDIAKYDEKMYEFMSSEREALSVLRLPKDTPKEQLLYEIKNRGIYYWNDNIQLIYEAEKYNLPPYLHQRNKILFDYCTLRIKSYELLYKSVENKTDLFQPQIEDLNKQIKKLITKLSEKSS